MLENKHNLTVDTQSKSIGNAFVEVVQNDNVALEVQIYNNNLLVDNTAYTYTLLSVLPSKERIIRQGEIGPNGYPVFNLGVEEMSETGIILAMVQVFDELGNRVTSYDFKYRMKEDLSTGGVVPNADNPKFVIITEDSLSQTVQDAQQSKIELDEMKTDTEGVTHLTPNDRLVSDYNKINSELAEKADATSVYTKKETDNLLEGKTNATDFNTFKSTTETHLTDIKNNHDVKVENLVVGGYEPALITDYSGSYSYDTSKLPNGSIVYLNAYVYPSDLVEGPLMAYLRFQDDGFVLSVKITEKTNLSYVGAIKNPSTDYRIGFYGTNKGLYLEKRMIINLTETFGAGNEPTREEMDTLIGLVPDNFWEGTLNPTKKLLLNWQLKMIRQNRNAILALGGTIV